MLDGTVANGFGLGKISGSKSPNDARIRQVERLQYRMHETESFLDGTFRT